LMNGSCFDERRKTFFFFVGKEKQRGNIGYSTLVGSFPPIEL
jgi:hypothetical protein